MLEEFKKIEVKKYIDIVKINDKERITKVNTDLFINKIFLNKDKIPNQEMYPFNIECIKNFSKLELNKRVTFLVGENGIGKSTFMEALAITQGLNPEGGTQNFMFKTKDTHTDLWKYLNCYTNYRRPKTKFFLRAESFYNFSTEMERLVDEEGWKSLEKDYGGRLHECSHGESFLKVVQNRFSEDGLYILDEPEAALSASRQLSLLYLIDYYAKNGSQFIIATHSPILISYRDGEIFNLNDNFKKINYEETEIYQTYKLFLDNPYSMQEKLFNSNND
jgi:predicted ATPase